MLPCSSYHEETVEKLGRTKYQFGTCLKEYKKSCFTINNRFRTAYINKLIPYLICDLFFNVSLECDHDMIIHGTLFKTDFLFLFSDSWETMFNKSTDVLTPVSNFNFSIIPYMMYSIKFSSAKLCPIQLV